MKNIFKRSFLNYFLSFSFFLLFFGCSTFYEKNILFNESFSAGEIERANEILNENKDQAEGKQRFLYLVEKGVVLQLLGQFEESNRFFEDAYLYTEDLQKNYALEALSLISNPMVKPYRGEDFEIVQVHYFKAINYLRLNQLEEAMVEARRLNIKLNDINDKYGESKNRYKQDAFAQNLMGIIFEAGGEINNAFISYRNAFETYKNQYSKYFGVDVPGQLKYDLLRTAYLNGFKDELERYENEFNMSYQHKPNEGGELIFFLNNGLGPVKSEWSINFAIVKGAGGVIAFENKDLGLSFSFPSAGKESHSKLGDLKVVRVAFPKYIEREPFYHSAQIQISDSTYPLYIAQDLNEIAIKTLEDRMLREFATSLLRLAIKQAAEYALREKSEGWGAVLSLVNAVTEKADTRNWQTLPYNISYTRIPLPSGKHQLQLKSFSTHVSNIESDIFEFDIKPGETKFHLFHILKSERIDTR